MRNKITRDNYLEIYENSGCKSLEDFSNQLEKLHKLMEDLGFDRNFYDLCDLMDFVYDEVQ